MRCVCGEGGQQWSCGKGEDQRGESVDRYALQRTAVAVYSITPSTAIIAPCSGSALIRESFHQPSRKLAHYAFPSCYECP